MAERKKVIILMLNNEPLGVYGSLKDMCDKNKGLVYSTILRKKDWPIQYKGHLIYKINFR